MDDGAGSIMTESTHEVDGDDEANVNDVNDDDNRGNRLDPTSSSANSNDASGHGSNVDAGDYRIDASEAVGHPYQYLTPDVVIDAVESTGRLSDARILALNSYENRVYQVGIEGESPVIVKFYRPQRWSTE